MQGVHVAYETFGSGEGDVQYFKSQMSKGISPIWFEIQSLERTIKGQESKRSRIERMEPDLKANKIFVPITSIKTTELSERQFAIIEEMKKNLQSRVPQNPIKINNNAPGVRRHEGRL